MVESHIIKCFFNKSLLFLININQSLKQIQDILPRKSFSYKSKTVQIKETKLPKMNPII